MTTTTIELTSKKFKKHKIIAFTFIYFGLIMSLLLGNNNTQIVWGCIFFLYGAIHLSVTRILIWWYHK